MVVGGFGLDRVDRNTVEGNFPSSIGVLIHNSGDIQTIQNKCSLLYRAFSVLSRRCIKGSRIGHSVKVSLWCVTLLINTRFRFFFLF